MDPGQELVEAGAGEPPVERPGLGVVMLLEGKDLVLEMAQVIEVIGGQELALDDGKVDFVG